MPLLLDLDRVPEDRLRELTHAHAEGIEETVSRLTAPGVAVRHPMSLRTAIDLGEDLAVLLKMAEDPAVPARLRAAIVNVSYDGMIAMIDLLKSHTDVPSVPRARPSSP